MKMGITLAEMRERAKKNRENLSKYEGKLEVLNVNYDPTRLSEDFFIYKKKHEEFYLDLSDTLSIGASQNFIVSGRRGTGKTSLTRFFSGTISNDLEKEGKKIGVLYVDCRNHYKKVGIFEELLGEERKGKSFSAIERQFKKYIEKYDRVVIILDEGDSLSKVDAKDVLFSLSRVDKVVLVVTSLSGRILDNIQNDTSTLSSFNPETYPFFEYSKDEIKEILVRRLLYVFGYEKKSLNKFEENVSIIAEQIAEKLHYDLRIGMDALIKFVKDTIIAKDIDFRNAEVDDWLEDFQKCIFHARKNFHKKNLNDMDSQDVLMLFAISLFDSAKRPSIANAYEEFDRLCENSIFGVKPCSKRQFENHMDTFALYEYFKKEPERRGRSNVKVLVMPDDKRELIFEVVKERFSLTEEELKLYLDNHRVKVGDLLGYSEKQSLKRDILSKFGDFYNKNKNKLEKKWFLIGSTGDTITKEFLEDEFFVADESKVRYKVISIMKLDEFATGIDVEIQRVLTYLKSEKILIQNPTTKTEFIILPHIIKKYI